MPIGSMEALLVSINTLKDGSMKISFEVNPSDFDVVSKLMELYLINERLFTLGIVRGNEKPELYGE